MLVWKMKCTLNEMARSHAVTARFGETQNAVIVVGAGIAGLSAAASLHKVCVLGGPTSLLMRSHKDK